MEARNRKIEDWYGKIKRGEIKLPRFQRFEAWDRLRISSLLEAVINDLPLGITLVLEIGEEEKFVSRFLETSPQIGTRTYEHLLDGQQRLTALWRMFHNNYERETYFVYLEEFDNYPYDEEREDMVIYCRGRYLKSNGDRYPLWCDDPAKCLQRGFIPTDLLKPEDIQPEIDSWLQKATANMEPDEGKDELKAFYDYQKRVSDRIKDLRATVANYNLPYLSLPAHTDKSVALKVFINMNTNSKPLSMYDIIVAEVESVMEQSLHDLLEQINQEDENISRYEELSNMVLTTSALLQNHLPNQRGAWDMDKRQLVHNWDGMKRGLSRMAEFLKNEGIYDYKRLPTNAVLGVIAALYRDIAESGDKRGHDELLLKRYLWYSFFTDRYENSAATRAFADFIALRKIICNEKKEIGSLYEVDDVPIFSEHSLVDTEELLTADWPKRVTIRGRGILAVTCRLGAFDFSTGEKLDIHNIDQRHYHHIFPDSLLKETETNSFLALNCALISDKTNISIGRKAPLEYLRDRHKWSSEGIVKERLESHIIPISELANGGYENLSEEDKKAKIRKDFDVFLSKRAELVSKAVNLLVEGRQLNASKIFGS